MRLQQGPILLEVERRLHRRLHDWALFGAIEGIGHHGDITVGRQPPAHVAGGGAQAEDVGEDQHARERPLALGGVERRVGHAVGSLDLDFGLSDARILGAGHAGGDQSRAGGDGPGGERPAVDV